jgi:hypothetical protein
MHFEKPPLNVLHEASDSCRTALQRRYEARCGLDEFHVPSRSGEEQVNSPRPRIDSRAALDSPKMRRAPPASGDAQVRLDLDGDQLPDTPPGVPPWARHSRELMPCTQPWPLQAFWPLHELVEDLQALWPLQALTPLQSVELLPNDGLDGVCALTTDATSVPAANALAAAMTNDFFI